MENQTFIEKVAHAEIAATTKLELDLNDLRGRFGNNFNTLQLTNTSATANIAIYLDGIEVAFITKNNGVWAFDWESGINYNMLAIENLNIAALTAQDVKVFVGRTGA